LIQLGNGDNEDVHAGFVSNLEDDFCLWKKGSATNRTGLSDVDIKTHNFSVQRILKREISLALTYLLTGNIATSKIADMTKLRKEPRCGASMRRLI
jgi:hypothetical protein